MLSTKGVEFNCQFAWGPSGWWGANERERFFTLLPRRPTDFVTDSAWKASLNGG